VTGGDAGTVDVDRGAPVVVAEEILVEAPVAVVWALHTDVSGWTSWRSDIEAAELSEPFAVGSTFHWSTGGLSIASTIMEVRSHRRTAWGGPAAGIVGVHVWEFTPEDTRTRVATIESWAGPTVEGDLTQANIMLAGHITTWLRDLKRAAE
jgi:Polyketide cyclase / dehydrase and lipid transport